MRLLQEKEFANEKVIFTDIYGISSDYIYVCGYSGKDTLVFKINAQDLEDYEYQRIKNIMPNQIIRYSGFDGYDIRVIGSERTFGYATLINLNEKDLSDYETVGFSRKGGWSIIHPSGSGFFSGCVVCGCHDSYLIAYDTQSQGIVLDKQYGGGGGHIRFLTETKDYLLLGVPAVTSTEGCIYAVSKSDPDSYYSYLSSQFFSLGYFACGEKNERYAYFSSYTSPARIFRFDNDNPLTPPLYITLPATGMGLEDLAMGVFLDYYQNTPWCVCVGGEVYGYGDTLWTWDTDWSGSIYLYWLYFSQDYKGVISCGFSPHDVGMSHTNSVMWFVHDIYKNYGGITMWEKPLSALKTDKVDVCIEYDAGLSFDLVAAFGEYNYESDTFSVTDDEHAYMTAPSGKQEKCLTVPLSADGWRDVGVFAGRGYDSESHTFSEIYDRIISSILIVARNS